jgi:hypothetical protein
VSQGCCWHTPAHHLLVMDTQHIAAHEGAGWGNGTAKACIVPSSSAWMQSWEWQLLQWSGVD